MLKMEIWKLFVWDVSVSCHLVGAELTWSCSQLYDRLSIFSDSSFVSCIWYLASNEKASSTRSIFMSMSISWSRIFFCVSIMILMSSRSEIWRSSLRSKSITWKCWGKATLRSKHSWAGYVSGKCITCATIKSISLLYLFCMAFP